MRVLRLILLGILTYVIAMVFLFPAAPVVNHFKPQLGPVALNGVSGSLFNGKIDDVRSTDDLLPLEARNVSWRLAPGALLKGGAGVSVGFDAYGGSGKGLVTGKRSGDVEVTDFEFDLQAKELEPLLPVPIAEFSGTLSGVIDMLKLENQLLTLFEGVINWQNAEVQRPFQASLGDVNIDVKPEGQNSHLATIDASGGDLSIEGTVLLGLNGDFTTDVLFTPAGTASQSLLNNLRQLGRADAQGRVRVKETGNVNRLL